MIRATRTLATYVAALALGVGAQTTYHVATTGNDGNTGGAGDPFLTIQAGIDAAIDGDTVLVADGTYVISSQVNLAKGVTLTSVNGKATTTIDAQLQTDVRCLYITHADAIVDGFTIDRGKTTAGGGGIRMTAGEVRWCTIKRCTANGDGGSIYMQGGIVHHCVISNATNGIYNGNVFVRSGALVSNCLFYDNTYRRGGAAFVQSGGVVENCTAIANYGSEHTGGIYNQGGGVVRNTIMYFNDDGDHAAVNYGSTGSFVYCCATPLPGGAGNIGSDPRIVSLAGDDYHLLVDSPCRDAGTASLSFATTVDLDGNPRVANGAIDIGCYEYVLPTLACAFTADVTGGLAPLTVNFTSTVDGTDTVGVSYAWDFDNDATIDSTAPNPSHSYTSPGTYTVTLTVQNANSDVAVFTEVNYIQAAPAVLYVSPTGNNVFPYDSWADAANSIQDAVDASVDGSAVIVADGTYAISSQVNVSKGISLTSVNGQDVTTIDGQLVTRCIYLNHPNAVVEGFTLYRGKATSNGGGLNILQGSLGWCTVASCTASEGGAIYAAGGLVHHSIIRDTTYNNWNGSIYMWNGAVLRNCLVYDNVYRRAGGVFMQAGTTVENCTVVVNQGNEHTGGIYNNSGTVVNTIIYFNNDISDGWENYQGVGSHAITYSCTTPLPAGTGNIDSDPLLIDLGADDFRLLGSSPCRDAGDPTLSWLTAPGAVDLDGNPRLVGGLVDIGAYQYQLPPLDASFVADVVSGLAPLEVQFTASVTGSNTVGVTYAWDFDNNGTTDATGQVVSHTYAAGLYSIKLTATNANSDVDTFTRVDYVKVGPPVNYVATDGGNVFPYDTWATAALDPQDAVDAGVDGTLTLVADGTYTRTAPVTVAKGLTLRSANPLGATLRVNTGTGARTVVLNHADAHLDGFTIAAISGTAWGGGVHVHLYGTIENCDIVGIRQAHSFGAGASLNGGTIRNCTLRNGLDRHVGGLGLTGGAIAENCVIADNTNNVYDTSDKVGGVSVGAGCVLRNCLVTGNQGIGFTGGVLNAGLVENCTIVGNTVDNVDGTAAGGIRANSGTVRNCIVVGNSNV